MSTDDSAAEPDDSDSARDGYARLRARLRNLPQRTAPPSFEADLERRLTPPARSPFAGVLRMNPLVTVLTTLGGLLLFVSFLLSPGKVDTTRSSAAAPQERLSTGPVPASPQAKADTAAPDSLAGGQRTPVTLR